MAYPPQVPSPYATPPIDLPHYGIGFVDAVKRGFTKYARFDGRASLSEYWWWALFSGLVQLVLLLFVGIAGSASEAAGTLFSVLWLLTVLALVVPSIALAIRRLHDTGRPGVYYCLGFIPFVGGIILLVFLAGGTTPAAQQFGPPYLTGGPYGTPPPPAPYPPAPPSGQAW